MNAIILAGGKATRMKGQDKAFIRINNQFLINRQLRLLKRDFKKIIIVTNSPQKYKSLKGVKVITDLVPHQGPLGGIYSGLLKSNSIYNFVLACDMPFLNKSLIRYIIRHKGHYDVLVPKINKKIHPLFGIYAKNCIPVIEKSLNKGRLRVSNIFPKLNCRFISGKEARQYDGNLFSLFNLNTRQDLRTLRKLI